MLDYFMFWFSKGLASLAWVVALFLLILLIHLLVKGYEKLKHSLCKHEEVFERGTDLDVICNKCGKNLGFTGRFDWDKQLNRHKGE